MKSTHLSIFGLFVIILMVNGCDKPSHNTPFQLVDSKATNETQALFYNLDQLRKNHVLFGHEDALAYGVNWRGDADRSDVKDITGSHPAVYGWDVGHIELGRAANLDNVDFDEMRKHIQDAYRRSGVITISWHLDNPYNGESSWDRTHSVEYILPGRSHHAEFEVFMHRLADYFESLVDDNGNLIPIIFRPWHEHTGTWFWWSADFTKEGEYAALWQYTVKFLRDERGLNNLLYAYSPSNANFESMWETYPGDEWVDIIGFDEYFRLKDSEEREQDIKNVTARLKHIVLEAEKRGKIPAFTETGLEALPDSVWFTDFLLRSILADEDARRIAFVLVWRNSNNATDRQNHFYAPYPEHPSAPDFIEFYKNPITVFEDNLPDMYTIR